MQYKLKLGLLTTLLVGCSLLFSGFLLQGDAAAQPGFQEAINEQQFEQKISTFFNDLTTPGGSAKSALEELFRDGPLSRNTAEMVDSMAAKYQELKDSGIGTFHAVERIDRKLIGKDVIVFRYLYKCDNFPVVWYFTFYRFQRSAAAGGAPSSSISSNYPTWSVIGIRFDTNLEPLFLTN